MSKHINLLNQKFGSLTVVSNAKRGWECRCVCGKTVIRNGSILLRRPEANKSCGCQCFNHGRKKPNFESQKNKLFTNYSYHAKRRNIEFKLKKDYFNNLLIQPCYYCGSQPNSKMDCYGEIFTYNGIDRIQNDLGYTEENTVTCCFICNKSKSDLSLEEWKDWIKRVSRFPSY